MVEVVGVRFKPAGKVYYFAPGDLQLEAKDKVIVETARGVEFGELVIPPREVEEDTVVLPLKQVIRKAGQEDEAIVEQNRQKEKDAFQICLKKIADHRLPMKLVDVEYTFDGNKIIFSFTAEGRVDFRELVKDLAAVFRTRIELRQIGVRDEAKMLGGIGSCGRVLCCASFLGDFEPVSIRMAKDQKLSLNPTKISGICGRLMCCLKYENGVYGQDEAGGSKSPLPLYLEQLDVACEEDEILDDVPEPSPGATAVTAPKGKGSARRWDDRGQTVEPGKRAGNQTAGDRAMENSIVETSNISRNTENRSLEKKSPDIRNGDNSVPVVKNGYGRNGDQRGHFKNQRHKRGDQPDGKSEKV